MKRKLVVAFLICFALWPLLQHALVRHYGVDPWRLAAWGMYSVPGSMRTLRVVVLSDERSPYVLDTRLYTEAETDLVARLRNEVQALGRLADTGATADALLALHPEWDGVALPVLTLQIDRESARTQASIEQHTTWRAADRPDHQATLQTFATP